MRTFALLLCSSILCPAWQTFVQFPSFGPSDRPLREFLELTNDQLAAINRVEGPAAASARRALDERQRKLLPEILAETARSPLRPPELGRLHSEWELNRRELVRLEQQLREARQAVLNAAQREKLAFIERTRPLAPMASSIGLAPPDCSSGFEGLASSTIGRFDPQLAASCQAPPVPSVNYLPTKFAPPDTLVRFLNLTPAQEQRFQQIREAFPVGSDILRMRTVVQEIVEETQRAELDPLALGLRYAEVESLRRNHSERLRRFEAANREVLTPDQRNRLAILEEAIRLRPTSDQARSASIVGQRCQFRGFFFLDGIDPSPGFARVVTADFFWFYAGDCPDTTALEQLP